MKEIKIDCFSENEVCQVVSSQVKLEINNPLEKQSTLIISNHSQSNCHLKLSVKCFDQNDNDFLSQINLLITGGENLFFQNNLINFLNKKVDLGLIDAKSTKEYLFNFDFLKLALENQKIILNFDLLFDFDCQQIEEKQIAAEKTQDIKSTQPAVLATKTNDSKTIKDESFWISPFFYLLSSLFVIVFFVIIRFINGKKKQSSK